MKNKIIGCGWILLLIIVKNGFSAVVQKSIPVTGENEKPPIQIRSKQTGYNANSDSLIIGTKVENTLNKLNIQIPNECTRLNGGLYIKEYETKVLKRSRRSFGLTADERTTAVDISKYFMFVSKDVWSCRKTDKREIETTSYYEIENELISINDIYEIKYYDGVTVSVVNYFGSEKRVKLKEKKCLVEQTLGTETSYTAVRCNSVTAYYSESGKIIPNTHNVILRTKRQSQPSGHYLHRIAEEWRHTDTVLNQGRGQKAEGRSLRIGNDPLKMINTQIRYKCIPEPGIDPSLFAPECYQKTFIDTETATPIYARITQKDFVELFTIVERKVYFCKAERSNDNPVYSVKQTLIGKGNIKEVEFGQGITELYSIRIENGKSIRYTEVKYFDASTRKPVEYVVLFKDGTEEDESSVSQYSKNYKRCDIQYQLTPRTIYRTLINPEGFNIRVGSRPTEEISFRKDMRCQKMEFDKRVNEFNTEFKFNAVEDNEFHAYVTEDSLKDIEYKSRNAWECSPEGSTDMPIIRVENYFKVLIPVHQIETYDGVEITVSPSTTDRLTKNLKIFEIKYLKLARGGYRPVKIIGNRLKFPDYEDVLTASAVGSSTWAIEKNEMFSSVDQVPIRRHNEKAGDTVKFHKFKIMNNGEALIKFTIPSPTTTPDPDLLICKNLESHSDAVLPYFEILNARTNAKIEEMHSAKDVTFNSKYFENSVHKIWKCNSANDEGII
ncbi:hypothetical protein LSTR_LSTR008482 [Laodelphax striatellus]|uniref:Uncharacterized protein n=1 Tax=Laodelphax striatellus TaxID=195883 RepID=A0A482X1X0_LAOST|nr:hypothetical protein LSTR_LSTR008482 [Laodelphax striatellus]